MTTRFVDAHIDNMKRLKDLLNLSQDVFQRVQDLAARRMVPDTDIVKWLKSPRQRVLLSVIAVLLLSSVTKLVVLIWGTALKISPTFRSFTLGTGAIYVVEAFLVILVTGYIVTRRQRDDGAVDNPALKRGIRAENQFFTFWPLLWFSWFVLYLILAFNAIKPLSSPYLSVWLNLFNNLSGLFIFAMFYELSERTTDGNERSQQQLWLPMLMVLLFIAAAEALFYYANIGRPTYVSYAFQLFSGLLVGVFTGLLVSRLTSRLFSFPLSALVVLTLFAVIQPVFPVLAQSSEGSAPAPAQVVTQSGTTTPVVSAAPASADTKAIAAAAASASEGEQTTPIGASPVSVAPPNADVDGMNRAIAYFVAFAALYAKIVLLITIEWMRERYGILYYMVNVARIFDNERDRRMGESFTVLADALLGKGIAAEQSPDVRPLFKSS